MVETPTPNSLTLEVDTSLSSRHVIHALEQAVEQQGMPESICCDNGPDLTSRHFLGWRAEDPVDPHSTGTTDAERTRGEPVGFASVRACSIANARRYPDRFFVRSLSALLCPGWDRPPAASDDGSPLPVPAAVALPQPPSCRTHSSSHTVSPLCRSRREMLLRWATTPPLSDDLQRKTWGRAHVLPTPALSIYESVR